MTGKEILDTLLEALKLLLSWPVIVLVLALALRKRVDWKAAGETAKGMAARISKASIAGASFELSPKTVETVVGKTNFSAVPTRFEVDSLMFHSRQWGFEIGYPAGSDWTVDLKAGDTPFGQQLAQSGKKLALTLISGQPVGGFHPNVNVFIEPVGDMKLAAYWAVSVQSFLKAKVNVTAYHPDEATQSASFSYELPEGEMWLECVARVTLARGLAFLATCTSKKAPPLPTPIKGELNAILNSFAVTDHD